MNEDNKIPDVFQPVIKQLIAEIPTVTEIEQENFSTNSGCGSNSVENDLCNGLSQLDVSKRKRRRKPRYKKEPKSINHKIDYGAPNNEINLEIKAVTNQATGKIFRIKNDGCRHIHSTYYSGLNGGITKINSASHMSAVTTPNDKSLESNCKSPIKVKNGTSHKHSAISQFDRSNLQSSSVDLQNASASNSPRRKDKVKRLKKFPNYWLEHQVREGLLSGQLIKGVIRINAKNFREAYVNNEDRSLQDYFIQSTCDRNRALEGDVVAIQIKPESEWTEKQKTAIVVYILEKVHSRTAVGFLQLMPDRNKRLAAFIPRDCRVPRIKIPMNMCPPSFYQSPNRYESMLFKARINMWTDIKYAAGVIVENVGVNGDLESETCAILAEHDLDATPFAPELLQFVPYNETIPETEFLYREDLRKRCIFTIDPLTARDLDDAVSCRELENGNLEVGVHISDVAYFLLEGTPLDRLVCKKATTIYLVNSVYHMLPQELCMLCSLLPGSDKRAFSVFWEMTKTGYIIRYRFVRSVINSCTQLAYEHAQLMIEDPDREFAEDELPRIHGGFTYKDISKTVNYLQAIAVNLRESRFERGSLRIDQTKLIFRLDEDTGEPSDCIVYENKEANRLIEEFMLLANITVAQKISECFPDLAFLRCHDPPNPHLMVELKKNLKAFNIDLDISSSKSIQTSIWDIRDNHNLGKAGMDVIHHLLAKPMTRALYFCAANASSYENYQHYALHIPIYTHFTSPIRRYADIMVHRLLAACLGYCPKPPWTVKYVTSVANNCNKQKYNAKCAGEASSDLYLAHYVAEHQPFIHSAVVVDVKNCSFDILVVGTGSIIRMYPNNFGDEIQCVQEQDNSKRKFLITFPETAELPEECYVIQLFAIVKINLCRRPKTNKLEAKLLRPINSQSFEGKN